jgi:hypothetical protein
MSGHTWQIKMAVGIWWKVAYIAVLASDGLIDTCTKEKEMWSSRVFKTSSGRQGSK